MNSEHIAVAIAAPILAAVIAVPLYLLGVFATFEWNPGLWGPVIRFCIGAIWFFLVLVVIASAILIE